MNIKSSGKSLIMFTSMICSNSCLILFRFHLLAEFDDGKRSCRKRLAGHNERRRKPQLDNSNKVQKLLQLSHGTIVKSLESVLSQSKYFLC